MRRSAALLGVNVLRMLDYAEGDLTTVDYHHLVGRLVEPIRMHRPEVVLTFGPDGVTGDTDHVTLSRAVGDAVDEPPSRSSTRTIEEDQVAWRIAKLYHLVVPTDELTVLGADRAPAGYGSPRMGRRWTSRSASWCPSSWLPSNGTCRRPAPTGRSPAGTPIGAMPGWPTSTTASRSRTWGRAGTEAGLFDGLA